MTEPTIGTADDGWIAELVMFLSVARPEGFWQVSISNGPASNTEALQVPNHCDAAPSDSYVGNPFLYADNLAIAGSITVDQNCRIIPPVVGADFTTVERDFRARSLFGEFTLDVKTGNCGRQTEDKLSRDNKPGFVEDVLPGVGFAYDPGGMIVLMKTIECPELPESLLLLRDNGAGDRTGWLSHRASRQLPQCSMGFVRTSLTGVGTVRMTVRRMHSSRVL